MRSNRNVGLLIVFLLITVAMAVAFFPAVNQNVDEGLRAITAIDTDGMDNATRTIFDSITYARSIHILAMLLVGFGFLMAFLRGHEFTSLTATFLAVAIAIPVYMLVKSFLPGEFEVMEIGGFLFAEFAAASLLICMGAVLGRLKMDQYFVLAILFTIAYIFNEWLLLESGLFKGFLDTGGSVAIHAFGAYFGLGVVATTEKKFRDKPSPKADKISNEFCLLGSMILWLFWPSFTSSVVEPEKGYLTVLNTVLALCGSTLATYVFTKLIRGKIEIEDIANAALAGGVAIGSTCSTANPGFAMVIGICAGTLSTLGFAIIAPKVCKLIRGTDTCGVHNLHGMPGLLGGLFGIAITGNVGVQVGAVIATVVVGLVLGRVCGAILSLMGTKEDTYNDEDDFILEE
ncbi:MAG: ammonium transporter [Clostridiales bacterium]|nr:ammonium transporter [Clostridiales bacterium]MDY4172233.1 ammonium transporter [Evtepia sp.]